MWIKTITEDENVDRQMETLKSKRGKMEEIKCVYGGLYTTGCHSIYSMS